MEQVSTNWLDYCEEGNSKLFPFQLEKWLLLVRKQLTQYIKVYHVRQG